MVRSEDLRGTLVELEDPAEACAKLIESANEAGGHDNVTVVIVKFTGSGLPEATAEDEAVTYRKYSFSSNEAEPGEDEAPGSERSEFRDTSKLPAPSRPDGGAAEDSASERPSTPSRPGLLAKASSATSSEDSVAVPMEGLPPRTLGAIIMAGVTLILVVGFYFFR